MRRISPATRNAQSHGYPSGHGLPGKERFLNKALRIDDDVAEAMHSANRSVPTYTKSQITSLKNNYNGATPDPGYIPGWKLTLDGLASGLSISLDIRNLLTRFSLREQITRLVCVEGWSAIAWWAGLRFDDLLRAFPTMSQAKWARVESSAKLDASGNPDAYFMSLDLATARHPQTLLATHFNGQSLTLDHGAPLRLLVPVKLGLKNVKAITKLRMSRKSQETIGPSADIPATTEFESTGLQECHFGVQKILAIFCRANGRLSLRCAAAAGVTECLNMNSADFRPCEHKLAQYRIRCAVYSS